MEGTETNAKNQNYIRISDSDKCLKVGVIYGANASGKTNLIRSLSWFQNLLMVNAILKEDRAIVTEIEGTTRDTIEEFVNINGIPLNLIDTAGIRNAKDEVERIGIEKSKKLAEDADLIIAILDSSKELSEEDIEILEIAKNKKSIVILNKVDLEQKIKPENPKLEIFNKNIINLSAKNKIGLELLFEKITTMFNLDEINIDNDIVITNERHKNLISKAIENLDKAKNILKEGMPVDIIAISLKDVLSNLGAITGEEAGEEIINEIFARFCLGK